MFLTQADQQTIAQAVGHMSGNIRLPKVGTRELEIAAMRYYIGVHEMSGLASKKVAPMRLTLAKLVYAAQERGDGSERAVLIMTDPAKQISLPEIDRLVARYITQYPNHGYGFWRNSEFEDVIFQISAVRLGESRSAVRAMSRASIDRLLTTYREQAAEAMALNEPVDSIRSQLAAEAALTMEDRRRASQDSLGKCWQCDAQKPRQVPCKVCGYIPKKART